MYKRILIVVGDREADRAALKEGIALAKVHGSEILFYQVLPTYTVTALDMPPMMIADPDEFQRAAKTDAQRMFALARVAADKAGVPSREALGTGADAAESIAEAAKRKACSLIVVGTRGRNALTRLLTGSVIPGLITRASVPVLVCRTMPAGAAVARTAPPRRLRKARVTAPAARPRVRAAQAA